MSGFQYLAGRSARANYAQTKGTKVTVNSPVPVGDPTTIVSVNISTKGNPILVMVSGDANPSVAGWGLLNIYRGSTAVGQQVQYESSDNNENVPYALQVIDVPAAGTYTYSLKCVSATSNADFGEVAGPVISAIEL